LSSSNKLSTSPVDTLQWCDKSIYIKRDDLLDPLFSGNKYRKLYHFLKLNPFNYEEIISYGGLQSNAMLSIAALAKVKGVTFSYYTRYMPKKISTVDSNYSKALELGMELKIIEADSDEALGVILQQNLEAKQLLIPQGGAGPTAKEGIGELAQEIIDFKEQKKIDELVVATPSGTGTTAVWLDEILSDAGIEVLTTAAVGDEDYLRQQMHKQRSDHHVTILTTHKKYHFAKPHADLLKQYQYFVDKNITFDLIYAPVMWQALQEHQGYWQNKTLLYIHSGGVMGNISQLERYDKRPV
jgi:1-aminocyclopropane-1-carboxylate deaminase/D-cysteine desulfhydrase-like pyridoxal-dependent ACC family enzyme